MTEHTDLNEFHQRIKQWIPLQVYAIPLQVYAIPLQVYDIVTRLLNNFVVSTCFSFENTNLWMCSCLTFIGFSNVGYFTADGSHG